MSSEKSSLINGATFEKLGEALRQAADRAGIGIIITEWGAAGGTNLYVNDAGLKIVGRTREEAMNLTSLDLVAPDDKERVAELARARPDGGDDTFHIKTTLLRPDGTRIPITSSTGRLMLDGKPMSVGFFWETASYGAETERVARIVSSSPDGILVVRANGVIVTMNAAGARILGMSDPKAFEGRSLADIVLAEDLPMMRERIGSAAKGKANSQYVYRARRADGSIVSVEVSSIPFEHEGAPAVLAFARDVTERSKLADQMARAERLAALSTLAAGLAHEINNPLTSAMLQVDVLEKQAAAVVNPDARAELVERFNELRRTHARIGAIMGDFGAFARSGNERREKVELQRVLAAVERMLAPVLRHRSIYVNELPVLPRVDADAGRLEQVFMNLLLNAVQALPDRREGNEIRVRGRVLTDGRACVEVKDNGGGISPDNLRRIFDPFFTTKPVGVGTGLGLTVCHNIIVGDGGELQVVSTLGGGCTMRVLLPPAAGEPAMEALGRVRPRVLIVDDEPHLATTLRMLLEERHDVVATTHGEYAVNLLLDGAAIDVVLCDLAMPAPDGLEIFRRVTKARPELKTRFIFMTGGVFNPATEEFMKAQALSRVQKPFIAEHVEALIARVAARR